MYACVCGIWCVVCGVWCMIRRSLRCMHVWVGVSGVLGMLYCAMLCVVLCDVGLHNMQGVYTV